MKQTFTLFTILILSLPAFSQTSGFTLTFEDSTTTSQYFYTDSILDSVGIWQIGRPDKTVFDSAYASDKAVVTLLDSALPANTKAAFLIKVSDSLYGFSNPFLIFHHKFDFDSARSGGIVEFSVDQGANWYPVSLRDNSYFVHYAPFCLGGGHYDIVTDFASYPVWLGVQPQDTTAAGVPFFTGTDSIWITDTIAFPQTVFPTKTQQANSLWFKFTAFSDSNATATHAGWMIDNISFITNAFGCGGGIDEANSSHLTIHPNPVESAFTISLTDESNKDYVVSLLDLTGREMMRRSFTGREVTLQRDGLAAGSYIVKATNTRTLDSFEKRVIFE